MQESGNPCAGVTADSGGFLVFAGTLNRAMGFGGAWRPVVAQHWAPRPARCGSGWAADSRSGFVQRGRCPSDVEYLRCLPLAMGMGCAPPALLTHVRLGRFFSLLVWGGGPAGRASGGMLCPALRGC